MNNKQLKQLNEDISDIINETNKADTGEDAKAKKAYQAALNQIVSIKKQIVDFNKKFNKQFIYFSPETEKTMKNLEKAVNVAVSNIHNQVVPKNYRK